jgi:predicted nucleic acid-binding protein
VARVVVDASLAVKWVLPEIDSRRALSLYQAWVKQRQEILAPSLLQYEVSSAIWKACRRGDLSWEMGRRALETFLRLRLTVLQPPNLVQEAWDMARVYRLPTTYDAAYLALAKLEGCELWSSDSRILNTVAGRLPWVRGLGRQ